MDVYPLDPLGLAAPDPVDAGWARAISRGPMTVEQVIARASARMDEQDEAEELARDPLAFAMARRPRRLIDKLRRR